MQCSGQFTREAHLVHFELNSNWMVGQAYIYAPASCSPLHNYCSRQEVGKACQAMYTHAKSHKHQVISTVYKLHSRHTVL